MGAYAIPFVIGSILFSLLGVCTACDFIKSLVRAHQYSRINRWSKREERASAGGVVTSIILCLTGAVMAYYFMLQYLK